ncbi:MAG: TRAP transporter small permease subunit [Caldilinea sp.]|nr:TRAP transporter small permease subunit [Caldilineaceae bacterium]MCB9119712.1 TRAP transporter small permease subunit [Caldilineaceae bacterium]MCO5213789.1 TRAP transporter small permease subunit [Caldilinea sp.]MCW5843550.1 TRAP transporter small permease subunit [Caldilinea sp.]HRW51078.1 TRAP transporter small permease subunit [Caldilinea sp.]
MRSLLKLAHGIDRISEFLGKIGIYLIIALLAVGFYNVVARYVGRFIGQNLSSNRLIEIQWYMYSVIFFLIFAYNVKHDVNVRVDILYSKWSPKRKAWVDLMGTLLILIPFCIIGIWFTLNPVMLSWGRLPDGSFGTWEMSPDPDGLPRAPIKSFIIVAFASLLLQAIAQAIKYLAVLTGHTEVEAELQAELAGAEVVE